MREKLSSSMDTVQISGSSGNESGSSGLDPSTFEHDFHTMVDQMETVSSDININNCGNDTGSVNISLVPSYKQKKIKKQYLCSYLKNH